MIKFDCAKVSGKLDYVKVTDRMSKGLKATVSLDGQKIPNIQMETEFFEELNEGDNVTLYTIVKPLKVKKRILAFYTALRTVAVLKISLPSIACRYHFYFLSMHSSLSQLYSSSDGRFHFTC